MRCRGIGSRKVERVPKEVIDDAIGRLMALLGASTMPTVLRAMKARIHEASDTRGAISRAVSGRGDMAAQYVAIVQDRARPRAYSRRMVRFSSTAMRLRRLHRASAAVVAAFVVIHVVNHLVGVAGPAAHLAFMQAARAVYRQPAIEALLLGCVAFQAVSGLWLLVVRRRERRGTVVSAQALSGAYLAFFLLVHVGAVMMGRLALDLDTNFHFAAAGLHVHPFAYFFVPYYGLAVLAVFAHLGCAARSLLPSMATRGAVLLVIPVVCGVVASMLIVMALAGHLHRFDVPVKYRSIYGKTL